MLSAPVETTEDLLQWCGADAALFTLSQAAALPSVHNMESVAFPLVNIACTTPEHPVGLHLEELKWLFQGQMSNQIPMQEKKEPISEPERSEKDLM